MAENVLDREFEVTAPNQAWAADITYIRTWEGWLYLAVVIDLFSRRVVGWSLADHLRTVWCWGPFTWHLAFGDQPRVCYTLRTEAASTRPRPTRIS